MRRFHVQELMKFSPVELYEKFPRRFEVEFDDGEIYETSNKEACYSRYCFLPFDSYPKVPILSKHYATGLKNRERYLTDDTHRGMLSCILDDICRIYNLEYTAEKEKVLALVYRAINNINNEVPKLAEEYVTSIDILDFIEVQDHPLIANAIAEALPNAASISCVYRTIEDALKKDPALNNNALALAVRGKQVKVDQVMQCVGLRGFLLEVNNRVLNKPVMTSYTKGMLTPYDYAADSRGAAKALYNAEVPLQDAEYFSRRLQLLTMVTTHIVNEDCGSTKYHNWLVKGPEFDDEGNQLYGGDLGFMIGKYYLDEESNQLKEINGKEKWLYGKRIKLRTSLGCKCKDKHAVCRVCFGALSKNVSRFANLGHLCSATMTQQTSQSVLSTKHIVRSAIAIMIMLAEAARGFFRTNDKKSAYLLRKDLPTEGLELIVARHEAPGLTDIFTSHEKPAIVPTRISSITSVDFRQTLGDEVRVTPVGVEQNARKAILSREFIQYLEKYGWKTEGHNFVFDLSKWNPNAPLLQLPAQEYSFADHSKEVAEMIESSASKIIERRKAQTPETTLEEFFSLVNSKLNVNLVALEIITKATIIRDKDEYGLPDPDQEGVLGDADSIIKYRSLGPAYTYEKQSDTIFDPRSFFKADRPDSLFDVAIDPKAVTDIYKLKHPDWAAKYLT